METPSDRVLSSWRQHAREGWEIESYSIRVTELLQDAEIASRLMTYPIRWVTGLKDPEKAVPLFRKRVRIY